MDLLTQRGKPNNEELLQQRFISRILTEESREIDLAQIQLMKSRGFTGTEFYNKRTFDVNDTILRYTHLQKHRFVDMRSRNTKEGRIKKTSHPLHNRILWGHANNIVRRLSFEYTERMKAMLLADFPMNI